MKATHRLEDIVGYFFILLSGIIPNAELKEITEACRVYDVTRQVIKVDGHFMTVYSGQNAALMEMWCEAHLQQMRVWQCPICSARNEPGSICGHMVFGRLLPKSLRR